MLRVARIPERNSVCWGFLKLCQVAFPWHLNIPALEGDFLLSIWNSCKYL